jgi:hypothetical protein
MLQVTVMPVEMLQMPAQLQIAQLFLAFPFHTHLVEVNQQLLQVQLAAHSIKDLILVGLDII